MWLRIYQHLLPNAKAWVITIDKYLRKFFEGLVGLPTDAKTFFDTVFVNLDPKQTDELTFWETQFGLQNGASLTEQQRRDRLEGAWSALGGQSPRYIQDTLQAAGFDVYVHDWWDPADLPTITTRNPRLILDPGTAEVAYSAVDSGLDAQDGGAGMQDGGILELTGYALVNKLLIPLYSTQDGRDTMQDGDGTGGAQDGGGASVYVEKTYAVPSDSTLWPYFVYIGGQTFPDHASIPTERKNEFETLCLKIFPTQLWIGILVDYT